MTGLRTVVGSRRVLAVLVLLAMLAPSAAFFYSRQDSSESLDRLSGELDAARAELTLERDRNNCIRDLQTRLYEADVTNSIRFNDFVVGLSVRGDIAALTAALQASGAEYQQAFAAYEARTGCP